MEDGDRVPAGEVTRVLEAVRAGERDALDRLIPLVYDELRVMARRQIGQQRPGQALAAVGLVHEAYLKLAAGAALRATDRARCLAIAARAMRQILTEHAGRRRAGKRKGGWMRTRLGDGDGIIELTPDELLSLDRALEALNERQRQVVECRFFGGMEEEEIAEALGISERTVRREWVKARARLEPSHQPEPSS